jgi:NTP pyrophosphatase (non-canonical NTP hydrolase)
MGIKELQSAIHENAVKHGWWEHSNIPEKLALIHSEVSEALEEYRDGRMLTDLEKDGKPFGFPSELADVVIRVMDLSGKLGINLESEIQRKHEYNKMRPYRHGGKAC